MNRILYAGKHQLTMAVVRHAHSSWELVYCTGGTGLFHFDDMTFEYEKGDIVIIPPYLPHSNSSAEGFTNIHINITDTDLPFQVPTLVKDDTNQFIYQVFNAAYFHFNGDPERRQLLLGPCGDLICGYLCASLQSHPLSKIVEEIESTIIHNYSDCTFELDTYLQSFPFSYDYLRKLFKKEVGVTPHKYLNNKRLQTAADMLVYGYLDSSNISDIAQMCGYREPLYFSRMFKKKYGMAPSYYMETQRTAPENAVLDSDSMKILLSPKED